MLALALTLCAQASQLVRPLELGPEPPETRAVAALDFRDERSAASDPAALEQWRAKAREGQAFVEFARACSARPRPGVSALYGTYWRSLLNEETGEFLFSAGVGDVNASGSRLVAVRLERDAACRQIFVAGTDAAARARAEAILRELRAGADFAALARERSEDKASALRGGDLAIFERGPRDALLREAAFRAKVGELVGPLETPLGLHILQRVGVEALDPRLRDDAWARARCILIAFSGAQGAGAEVTREHDEAERLAGELAARVRRGEDMTALAAQFDDDRGGRERSGDLGWLRRQVTAMPALFDRLFVEPPGSLIGPIASSAGYVLLRREDPGPRSRIVLRKSAFREFVGEVRGRAAPAPEAATPEWRDFCAARDRADAVGPQWAERYVEPLLLRSSSAADLAALAETLPEVVEREDGTQVSARRVWREFARALAKLEPEYMASVWPAREREIDVALAKLREQLVPLGDAALDELMRDLGMLDPRIVVSVLISSDPGPADGALTWLRGSAGSTVVRVALDRPDRPDSLHLVLQGAALALDASARAAESVPAQIERRLGRPLREDELGALLGEEAAAVVRRVADPRFEATQRLTAWSRDAGASGGGAWSERESATERGRLLTEIERLWSEHAAGRVTLEATLDAICAAAQR